MTAMPTQSPAAQAGRMLILPFLALVAVGVWYFTPLKTMIGARAETPAAPDAPAADAPAGGDDANAPAPDDSDAGTPPADNAPANPVPAAPAN